MAASFTEIDDFCRLCAMESHSGVIIYSAEGENLCLEEKISSCLRIEVSRDDVLPKRVCHSCNLLLDDFYNFSSKVSQVQQTLYLLLGLHLEKQHEPDDQVFLVEDKVKQETDLIKKELDEFLILHGNVEKNDFDVLLETDVFNTDGKHLLLSSNVLNKDSKHYCSVSKEGIHLKAVNLIRSEDSELTNGLVINNSIEGDQNHKRKMLPPHKTCEEEDTLKNNDFFNILMENNGEVLETSELIDFSILQDLIDENYKCDKKNNEDSEENRMNAEWIKKWGIICDQCQDVFYGILPFERHHRIVHNKAPVYICSYCRKEVSKRSLFKDHLLEHICDGIFKCKFCGKTLCSKEMLEIHSETVHQETKVHVCEECGVSFTSRGRLDGHQKKHAKKPEREKRVRKKLAKVKHTRNKLEPQIYERKKVEKLIYKQKKLEQKLCERKKFEQVLHKQRMLEQKVQKQKQKKLEKALRKQEGIQGRLEKKKMLEEKQKLDQEKVILRLKLREEKLKCQECGKVLQTRGGLASHKTAHQFGRQYMCHICGKTFTQKVNMQQHVKCHKGEKPYSCDLCEKRFQENSQLTRHKKFHSKDRPFRCSICGKMYKTGRCLKVHSRIHGNKRPFVCDYCGKGFLSSTKLKQHFNCHTGERPFACKYCDRTFTNYPNWLKHTRRRHNVDHKTGLSLKKEVQTQAQIPLDAISQDSLDLKESAIEFVEMPVLELKEDGRESVLSHDSVLTLIAPSILDGSELPVLKDEECQLISDLNAEDFLSNQVKGEEEAFL